MATTRAPGAKAVSYTHLDVYKRQTVAGLYGEEAASHLVVQYGGSMNAGNAAELLAQPDVDGGLIGGASLKADAFGAIVAAAGK